MNNRAVSGYRPVGFEAVTLGTGFWAKRVLTNRQVSLPIQYAHLRRTGRLAAWKLDWKPGMPRTPHIFWDSDVAKWIEAAACSLRTCPDKALERRLDRVIAAMARAQQADGYLNTHFIAVEPDKRWTNLRDSHELYCAGHLMEAAVAHYHATGKHTLLDVMCRYADHIDRQFGPRRGQKRGYPGHEEIELALVKLAAATGTRRYLDLAAFFINERGRRPHYFDREARARGETVSGDRARFGHAYSQSHLPVRQQTEVVGHAVRAMYLYCGMADVAAATGDASLLRAARRLWNNVTRRRMHVTGGIGPTAANEGFTTDYDLPTDTAYLETCAAIGLVFWAHRMLQAELDGDYADVMERALYNGVLSGVSLEGDTFFYANPLAVDPGFKGVAYMGAGFHYRRSPWFGCACCPTNVVRLLASLGGYIYSSSGRELCVHLFIGSRTEAAVGNRRVEVTQRTDYPWDERVRLTVNPDRPATFALALRIPGWCHAAQLRINGRRVALGPLTRRGYARVRRRWAPGDTLELLLPMPVQRRVAPPSARQVCGRVALTRGPLVYCVEEVDNGPNLDDLRLPRQAALTLAWKPDLLGGTVVIRGVARRRLPEPEPACRPLYSDRAPGYTDTKLTAVPYCLWAHRQPGAMRVWIRE